MEAEYPKSDHLQGWFACADVALHALFANLEQELGNSSTNNRSEKRQPVSPGTRSYAPRWIARALPGDSVQTNGFLVFPSQAPSKACNRGGDPFRSPKSGRASNQHPGPSLDYLGRCLGIDPTIYFQFRL
jgi:hypothetical protein